MNGVDRFDAGGWPDRLVQQLRYQTRTKFPAIDNRLFSKEDILRKTGRRRSIRHEKRRKKAVNGAEIDTMPTILAFRAASQTPVSTRWTYGVSDPVPAAVVSHRVRRSTGHALFQQFVAQPCPGG
jgi:hypothetical protein